jgi:signal transduction histidine kinase
MPQSPASHLQTAFHKGSLAGRLVAVAAIWSTLVLAITGWGLTALFRNATYASFDRELAISLDALAATVDETPQGALRVPRPPPDPRFSRPLSGRYWRVADVQIVSLPSSAETTPARLQGEGVRSRSMWDQVVTPPATLLARALDTPGEIQSADLLRGTESLRIAGRVIQLPGRAMSTFLMVAADSSEAEAAARRFSFAVAAGLVALMIGLVGAIFLQVRLGLEPLRRMGRELAEIRNGTRHRLEGQVPKELAPLAGELNALIDHNQEVVERARTHVGNLAHALKTPLSVILNESRTRKDSFAQLVAKQSQTMTRQVEHYLKRAAAAARAETLGARTPLGPVLDDIGRTLGRLYRHDGTRVEVSHEPNLVFRGEREDLEDLIGNLAENACKYGGGLVVIRATGQKDGLIMISIEDDGEGLEAEDAIAALKRGARLDESAPGSGLGLSICDELARAYGGSLSLSRSDLGGLQATLYLPAASQEGES